MGLTARTLPAMRVNDIRNCAYCPLGVRRAIIYLSEQFSGALARCKRAVAMSGSSYKAASASKLAYIQKLAELRLEAQLKLGLAADQRAMMMTSVLAVVDAALIGLLANSDGPLGENVSILALVIGFALAAASFAWSASPIGWEIAGNEPSAWLQDIVDNDTLHNGKAAMVDFYDDMILANDNSLKCNSNYFHLGVTIMFLALLVAGFLAAFRI